MKKYLSMVISLVIGVTPLSLLAQDKEEKQEMGFFITSAGTGDGANLGGLTGADAHCQALAEAAGSKGRTWRAYLSTTASGGKPAVNARDRIGKGPWYNTKGDMIASDVDDLHYNNANINYEMALNEKGGTINSGALGDKPTQHDILTGTKLDGTAYDGGEDTTCGNWTSNSKGGSARVGHSDRFRFKTPGSPWNSAHPSRGCGQADLEGTGGAGMFYCFAAD